MVLRLTEPGNVAQSGISGAGKMDFSGPVVRIVWIKTPADR
jgi:hypothetical protein